MAKAQSKALEKTTTNGAPPAHLADRMRKDAGRGVSKDQSDNLIPLIYVLQGQSPQVNKRGPDFIEGAEPGDIWLRNSPKPIVKGEVGFYFQSCFFSKDWVEWVPRTKGGGYAGRHDQRPDDAVEKPDPENPAKMKWTRPNGNHVIETRYHAGLGHMPDGGRLPYVIPISSTGHTVSRGWMFSLNSKQVGDVTAPAFASLWHITTKQKSNAAGDWFSMNVVDAGWVSEADYDLGSALAAAFESGAKVADEPEHAEQAEDANAPL